MREDGMLEGVKLKPCPFCGFGAYIQAHNEEGTHPKFFVECANCFCNVGEAYDSYGEPCHMFHELDSAVAAWNTRPADRVKAQLLEALKEFDALMAKGWMFARTDYAPITNEMQDQIDKWLQMRFNAIRAAEEEAQ